MYQPVEIDRHNHIDPVETDAEIRADSDEGKKSKKKAGNTLKQASRASVELLDNSAKRQGLHAGKSVLHDS